MAKSKADRFTFDKELANTLQGRIYKGTDKETGRIVVIKEAWAHLVSSKKSRSGHSVPENFLQERKMQMKLSKMKDCHESIVKGIDEWDDDQCYYIVMEFCTGELFDFISQKHADNAMKHFVSQQQSLKQEVMTKPTEWLTLIQNLFGQIVRGVAWLHSKNICHLDISLENTMILEHENKKQCKLIDFGLSQEFTNGFKYKGRVGKVAYMAPEAYDNKEYDPRAADIYCLGVMLFMMLIGAPPYKTPSRVDPAFKFIIGGRIPDVLKHWKRLRLVTQDALDCLVAIFKYEKDRITTEKLLEHPFIKATEEKKEKNNQEDKPDGKDEEDNDGKDAESMDVDNKVSNQEDKPATPMKRMAKMFLTTIGLAKYENNLAKQGYTSLGQFEDLCQDNGAILLSQCEFTQQDAQTFVNRYRRFKGN